jgi:hypothetical protein
LILEKEEMVTGTNCYNCKFIDRKAKIAEPKELNEQGGIDPKNEEEMKRAEKADLITLPGGTKKEGKDKKYCNNEKIKMEVTIRMCCAYWDNIGVKRPWLKIKKT